MIIKLLNSYAVALERISMPAYRDLIIKRINMLPLLSSLLSNVCYQIIENDGRRSA